MEKLFFERFPEYSGEIPVHEIHPNDMPSPPSPPDVPLSDILDAAVDIARGNPEPSGNFEDECMMALFDELPPT